jgi:type IV pilus assembly protein PilM
VDLSKRLKPATTAPRRPRAAVELAPEGALAAASPGAGQPPVYAFAALPAGALVPGIAEPNLRAPEAVAEALRTAIDATSPRSHAITLVVPDITARVFVLDFDTLPDKPAEALPVLRFRLRKMVPFDVEQAAVSYQRLPQNGNPDVLRVLATIMPGPILAEYEAAVRAAGYEPGAVLPSSLAALSAEESMEPLLTANLNSTALTTSITSGDDLLLFRTVELPETAAARVAEVQRSVAVAAAYYEDKLGAPARRLHYTGAVDVNEFARAVGDSDLEVVEMAPSPATGAATTLGPVGFAGVTGALAGVA